MSDTASDRASTQSDVEPDQSDSDGMYSEPYTVSSFTFSDRDTDSFLTVMFCGLRMYVDIFAVNLHKSSQRLDEHLHFLKVADVYELDGLTVEDFYDWVFEGCTSTFVQVEPPTLPTTPTLVDCLYPATRSYFLHANDRDDLELIEAVNDPGKRVRLGTRVHDDLSYSWPSFTPSQVNVCAENSIQALRDGPQEVRAADCDVPLFFKPYVCGDRRSAERELKAYTQIRQAKFSQLRTSTLFGLVHDNSGYLLGLLLHYIDCEGVTLKYAVTRRSLYQQDSTGPHKSIKRLPFFTKPGSFGEIVRLQTFSLMPITTLGSLTSAAATRQAGWIRISLGQLKVTSKVCPG